MPSTAVKNKLLVFLNLDGWGISLNTENNAIRKAQIPGFKNLVNNFPATVLEGWDFELSRTYRSMGCSCHPESEVQSPISVAKIISQFNLRQLRIASSSDFPLVSTFFNQSSSRLTGEDWLIVDNRRRLLKSFFNSNDLVDTLIKNIKSNSYNFIFSCISEIGQEVLKGDFLSVISAVENVSAYLDKIATAVLEVDGVLIVSSAYGGAEDVFNIGTGLANKKRTKNNVPLLIIGSNFMGKTIGLKEAPNNDLSLLSPQGNYLKIAPSILKILNLPLSSSMKEDSFI